MNVDRLVSLKVIGGFLDGLTIEFDPQLNCIIGARGTGKTTIIELVRWTLDAFPPREIAPETRRRVEKLVEGNLKGGRVELEIETRDSLRYTVTRSEGEAPIVLDAKGNPTALSISGRGFFQAAIYSQNEVETIAEQRRFQLQLLDSFTSEGLAELQSQFAEVTHQITLLAKNISPLTEKAQLLEERAAELPSLEAQLAQFASQDDPAGVVIDQAHAAKALRGREARAFETADEILRTFDEELATLEGRISAELEDKVPQEALDGPNGKLLADLQAKLRACVQTVDNGLSKSRQAISFYRDETQSLAGRLKAEHDKQELAFRELIEKHDYYQNQSAERTKLEKKRGQALEARAEAARLRTQLDETDKRRAKLVGKLSELRDLRFGLRKEVAEKLNASLDNIDIVVQQAGDTAAYQELLERHLYRSGVKHKMVAQRLRHVPPTHLANFIRAGDITGITGNSDLSTEQAAKLIEVLDSPETLAQLETVEVQDEPSIRLRVGDTYKDADMLSTGQKCTAILPILLLEGNTPVLIDQPEDNLDNRFIFETVVSNIQTAKKTRQLVFVTHNPNIPVLGDASLVVVMESDGTHARTATQGSVDACRHQIVTLLEGGQEAFKLRGKRYKF